MKKIASGTDAKEILLQAITKLYQPVASTMGPKGKTVIISNILDRGRYTKDGVTVAREIEDPDQLINAGIKIFREASEKTVKDAGDGTTTSTVLLYHLIKEVYSRLQAGANIVDLKNQLSAELDICVKEIQKLAIPLVVDGKPDINKIFQLATTSANGDEFVGKKIAEAYEVVGPGVAISVRETQKQSYLDCLSGMKLDVGYASQYFANVPNTIGCAYENPFVFVTDKAITKNSDILRIVDFCHEGGMPLIIFCTDIAGEALGTLNANIAQNNLKVCAVALSLGVRGTRDVLKDIAIYSGAKFCSAELGFDLDNISDDEIPGYLGSLKKFEGTDQYSILAGGRGSQSSIQSRIAEINEKITPDLSDWDREELLSRRSKLSGGFAVLYIGGKTSGEVKELIDRCDDAVLAVRSAVEAGYLPGCGKAYLMASKLLGKKSLLASCLYSITEQVLINAGNELPEKYPSTFKKIKKWVLKYIFSYDADFGKDYILKQMIDIGFAFGFNARTNRMENLLEAGVVDSAKVTLSALQNAVSTALAFLNTEYIIAEEKNQTSPSKIH